MGFSCHETDMRMCYGTTLVVMDVSEGKKPKYDSFSGLCR